MTALVVGGRERPDWYDEAACAGVDPALFFPEDDELPDGARETCAGCPVAGPCRDFASAEQLSYGVWAGELLGS